MTSNEHNNVYDLVARQRQQASVLQDKVAEFGGGGGSGPHMPDMDNRLGQVEGELRGLKQAQIIGFSAVGIVVAALVGLGVLTFNRIDRLSDRVDRLGEQTAAIPDKIKNDLLTLTKTLADVITASRQQAPQVILMPAPQGQPAPPPAPKQ